MMNRQQLCDVDLFSHRVSFEQNFLKQYVSNFHQLSESKGFIPPLPITKMMRIVFEKIVSCPMKEALTSLNRW